MFSKVLGDPQMKDSLETEYCVGAGGKSLIKQKTSKSKHNNQKWHTTKPCGNMDGDKT